MLVMYRKNNVVYICEKDKEEALKDSVFFQVGKPSGFDITEFERHEIETYIGVFPSQNLDVYVAEKE